MRNTILIIALVIVMFMLIMCGCSDPTLTAADLPNSNVKKTLMDLKIGRSALTEPSAMWLTADGLVYINAGYEVLQQYKENAILVTREMDYTDGYRRFKVDLCGTKLKWTRSESYGNQCFNTSCCVTAVIDSTKLEATDKK